MKNRRYEKIKSGLPREEKPKSGLEKSGKANALFAEISDSGFCNPYCWYYGRLHFGSSLRRERGKW